MYSYPYVMKKSDQAIFTAHSVGTVTKKDREV
jgi:hypothetical protein